MAQNLRLLRVKKGFFLTEFVAIAKLVAPHLLCRGFSRRITYRGGKYFLAGLFKTEIFFSDGLEFLRGANSPTCDLTEVNFDDL